MKQAEEAEEYQENEASCMFSAHIQKAVVLYPEM
jgi:hypothetical protein